MEMDRRQFVLAIAGAAVGVERADPKPPATIASTTPGAAPVEAPPPVDVGPLSGFSSEGVNASFREQGFFVIRRDKQVFALSSICTHKGCKVRVAKDESFYCKCHDSEFDRDGRVTQGPAKRNLPRLAVKLDDRRHLLVDPAQQIENRY